MFSGRYLSPYDVAGDVVYVCQAVVALWGIFSIVMVAMTKAHDRLIEFQDLMELGLNRFFEDAANIFAPPAPPQTLPQRAPPNHRAA